MHFLESAPAMVFQGPEVSLHSVVHEKAERIYHISVSIEKFREIEIPPKPIFDWTIKT